MTLTFIPTSNLRAALVVVAIAAGPASGFAVELSDVTIRLGVVPRVDGVKTDLNYNNFYTYNEFDRTNDHSAGYGLGVHVDYLAGRVDGIGFVYGVGFENAHRAFRIVYDNQQVSPWLGMQTYTGIVQGGVAFGKESMIVALTPYAGFGVASMDHWSIDLGSGERQVRAYRGLVLTAGMRISSNISIGNGWLLSGAVDWQSGRAWSRFRDSGPVGNVTDNTRYEWRGFGGSLGVGYRF